MKYERIGLSLSGLASHLIAVGGWNHKILYVCEKYSIARNQWAELPSLVAHCEAPGSLILGSNKVASMELKGRDLLAYRFKAWRQRRNRGRFL